MRFSIVIPTYNRAEDLGKCLASILSQTLLPAEVIVIDDGELPPASVRLWQDNFRSCGANLVYYRKDHTRERRGSSESRNKALELISSEIFFIFDDDVVLKNNFCAMIMRIWEDEKGDDKLIGVSGMIKNGRPVTALEKYFRIFFGLSSKYAWDVNRAGYQVWDEGIKERAKGFYVHGGVSSYRLNRAKALKFSTFSGGRTALEDVDFCLRAKKAGCYFIIEPRAKLSHYPSATSREGQFLMGFKESVNRRQIFKENCRSSVLNRIHFFWASVGWILGQLLAGHFQKARGMIAGLAGENKISQVDPKL